MSGMENKNALEMQAYIYSREITSLISKRNNIQRELTTQINLLRDLEGLVAENIGDKDLVHRYEVKAQMQKFAVNRLENDYSNVDIALTSTQNKLRDIEGRLEELRIQEENQEDSAQLNQQLDDETSLNVDEIINTFRKNFEAMSYEEREEYLKENGFSFGSCDEPILEK